VLQIVCIAFDEHSMLNYFALFMRNAEFMLVRSLVLFTVSS